MFDYEAILHKYSATCRSPDDEMENVHYLRSKLKLKKNSNRVQLWPALEYTFKIKIMGVKVLFDKKTSMQASSVYLITDTECFKKWLNLVQNVKYLGSEGVLMYRTSTLLSCIAG